MTAAAVIGITVQVLDHPSPEQLAQGLTHAIGSEKFPAPQGTLMATLIKGLLAFNLDWQFVLVGAFLSLTMELCGVKSLSFAVGAYLPLSTTAPIFVGGAVKGLADWVAERAGEKKKGELGSHPEEDSELGPGNLFATGLVAGGAIAGVVVAIFSAKDSWAEGLKKLSLEHALIASFGPKGYELLGALMFAALAAVLFRVARKKVEA